MAWTLHAFGLCTDLHTLVISTQHEAAAGRLAEPSVQGAGGWRQRQTSPTRATLPLGRDDAVGGICRKFRFESVFEAVSD